MPNVDKKYFCLLYSNLLWKNKVCLAIIIDLSKLPLEKERYKNGFGLNGFTKTFQVPSTYNVQYLGHEKKRKKTKKRQKT